MFLYNVMHFYMSAWFASLLLCFPSQGSFRDHSEAWDTPGPACLMHGSQINSQILATIVQSLRAVQDVMSCISMAYHVISCLAYLTSCPLCSTQSPRNMQKKMNILKETQCRLDAVFIYIKRKCWWLTSLPSHKNADTFFLPHNICRSRRCSSTH